MSWFGLSDWWLSELAGDPAYDAVVTPALLDILKPMPELSYADLGCGEGRVARSVKEFGSSVSGVDISLDLVRESGVTSLVADLLALPFRDNTFDGAFSVLVLEHLQEQAAFFSEAARLVKPGGVLAVVSNHPIWTAPGSTPIEDTDGEVLWRSGEYFSDGTTEVEVVGGTGPFHHRSIAALLNAAADAGWALEEMIERPHHELDVQSGIPRLLACRWRR